MLQLCRPYLVDHRSWWLQLLFASVLILMIARDLRTDSGSAVCLIDEKVLSWSRIRKRMLALAIHGHSVAFEKRAGVLSDYKEPVFASSGQVQYGLRQHGARRGDASYRCIERAADLVISHANDRSRREIHPQGEHSVARRSAHDCRLAAHVLDALEKRALKSVLLRCAIDIDGDTERHDDKDDPEIYPHRFFHRYTRSLGRA